MTKNVLFPLQNYFSQNGYYIAKENWNAPNYSMHFHDSVEITLLTQGTGKQIVNGTDYVMPTYTFSIMYQQDCHKYYDLSPDNV